MDGYETNRPRPVTRRRRRRSQLDIFKETYLPTVIACIAVILIIIFSVGAITRGIQRAKLEHTGSSQGTIDSESQVIEMATAYAAAYDYENALAALDAFSGKETSQMQDLRKQYTAAMKDLVLWEDNSKIPILSFQQLLADPVRGFASSNFKNHLTTSEFTKILQKLYENNYILVNLEDITQSSTNSAGDTIFSNKELLLPDGKKPVILLQTGVNYYTQMVDSDGDRFPDQNAPGFANRLLLDANGNIACELINSDGSVDAGAYDLVPILESFITTHPDFSYKGARAILAVTGHDGLFGYRCSSAAGDYFGPAYQDKQSSQAQVIVNALQQSGYVIACNTYADIAYGTIDAATLRTDLESWNNEISPILADVDILVYAKDSDIAAAGESYSGEKFSALSAQGFRYFIGNQNGGASWQVLGDGYARYGRLTVNADTIRSNSNWFSGMFDSTILDAGR